MQFTAITVIACAALAVAMPSEKRGGSDKGDSGNDTTCSQANNGKTACCNTDESSDGSILPLNGILGGSCELQIAGLDCQVSQTQACCPTDDSTGLINVGSACVPIGI